MPSGALTQFLKQGLARGMCPLCRVAHKVDTEYIWYFFDEYSGDADALDSLRRARGFCTAHAEALRRLEVDGFKSTLGLSTTYLDTIEGLIEEFGLLRPGDQLPSGLCPACAYRQEELERTAGYLFAEIRESENLEQLAADLREHIRKQGVEAREDEPGADADSWERARP